MSGATSYDDIALFGRSHIDLLKNFLELKNGVPSHDTINRVFAGINTQCFERLFAQWAQGQQANWATSSASPLP
jgi:hypothetical protein